MNQIILTPEQANIVAAASGRIDVLGPGGQLVAVLSPVSPDDAAVIAEVRRELQSPEPDVPADRVHAMLEKLDEMATRGDLTREKVDALVERVIAGEVL